MAPPNDSLTRRDFLATSVRVGAGLAGMTLLGAPAIVLAEGRRPTLQGGVMSGDVLADRAMLWGQASKPSRMLVDIADNPEFRGARQLAPVDVLPGSDLIGKLDATGLRGMQDVHYRVRFAALGDERALSEPVVGRLRLPPSTSRDLRFV
ncbi:PhoD-like phosphatase N-terminal domain-containing protein [Kushneria konosiri]|uniref:PhoD-like phosphatase N-terminal domain-containing protein n=1 Tax=Kushneria konosiri TaxID=698828 RepID=UPI001D1318FE|nr:PhoD-like phosphatase N-terminal domain-containing protein [Kushneria konosiri]